MSEAIDRKDLADRVVVLGMGGTIAGRASSPDDLVSYTAGQVAVADLLAGLPAGLERDLEVEQVAQIDSRSMDLAVWQRLCERLAYHLARPQVRAVVVTHGTDTLEETAFVLQSLLRPGKPVVLTCAMRPATALVPDGPQNISDALVMAHHPGAAGVMVVCAGQVHGAADVTKVHTYRLDAFSSGDAGALAAIENGRVFQWRPWPGEMADNVPDLRSCLPAFMAAGALPRVELVVSHACADGRLVDALLNDTSAQDGHVLRGLVVAGTGNGSVHDRLDQALMRARAAGVRVVRATRCPFGRVTPRSGDLLEESHGLSAVKARLALSLDLIRG